MIKVGFNDHKKFVVELFNCRGFNISECRDVAKICTDASLHGIQSHNAIKAFHLEENFGSKVGGCVPNAKINKTKKSLVLQHWNANKKIGPSVAYQAIEACMDMADQFGVGIVSVDNAWHYFWGGGYAIEMAKKGFIGYTICTALLSEVVPFSGKIPTLGTNPHTWAFPTCEIIGYPLLVDWATSKIAMGKVQQFKRLSMPLPLNAALDSDGNETKNPNEVAALLPFGEHKGYGLSIINELFAAIIGGSTPTERGRYSREDRIKRSTTFYFQAINPDFIAGEYDQKRDVNENIKIIIDDILKEDNKHCLLPGEIEAKHAKECQRNGCLLFTEEEYENFQKISKEHNIKPLKEINK